MIEVPCPACGSPISADSDEVGEPVRCPQCGRSVELPAGPAVPPPGQGGRPGRPGGYPAVAPGEGASNYLAARLLARALIIAGVAAVLAGLILAGHALAGGDYGSRISLMAAIGILFGGLLITGLGGLLDCVRDMARESARNRALLELIAARPR